MPATTEEERRQASANAKKNLKGSDINDWGITYDELGGHTFNAFKIYKAEESNSASLLRKTFRANGVYSREDMKYNTSFYRFRRFDPYNFIDGAFEMVFFTKPDLNIFSPSGGLTTTSMSNTDMFGRLGANVVGGTASSPYFQYLYKMGYRDTVLADLCSSYRASGTRHACPFIRILSNRRTSSLDLPDIVANEIETAQNLQGTKIYYPTSSMKSDEDAEFSMEFEDTSRLEIYNLFKAYDIYRQMKNLGLVAPRVEYIANKILHEQFSAYKFLLDSDGERIIYWAKAIGIYPKTISRSSFSEIPDKGELKISVQFKIAGWVEDMDPLILQDFNRLMLSYSGNEVQVVDLWDDSIGRISGENLDGFYVDMEKDHTLYKPYEKQYVLRGFKLL